MTVLFNPKVVHVQAIAQTLTVSHLPPGSIRCLFNATFFSHMARRSSPASGKIDNNIQNKNISHGPCMPLTSQTNTQAHFSQADEINKKINSIH